MTWISRSPFDKETHSKLKNCSSKLLQQIPLRKLRDILARLDLKKWLGAARVDVDIVRSVRPWKQWFLVCIDSDTNC